MRCYDSVGVLVPELLLPRPGLDFGKWAVIACDQFTSQPEYWDRVDKLVGEAPSTLRMILPEIFLEEPDVESRIQNAQQSMRDYLGSGVLEAREGIVYVERTVGGKTRKGLVLALDLERYDYNRGSTSLIRATEGTILERIPPRVRIRDGASLELPHILVLIDDPERTVIEPIAAARDELELCYDFELMANSGRVAGRIVPKDREQRAVRALEQLASPESFARKYGLSKAQDVLLFAMGDGNHSLATAKAYWEKIKPAVGLNHLARYALVEIENVHDEALVFEPIHRVLFGLQGDVLGALQKKFGPDIQISRAKSAAELASLVDQPQTGSQRFGVVSREGCTVVSIPRERAPSNLAVGTLQGFVDDFLADKGALRIDYVHGMDVVVDLGEKPGNLGLYLPSMDKSDLFKTVIVDGALPRKTFSMGEAHEKRFYLECRKIV